MPRKGTALICTLQASSEANEADKFGGGDKVPRSLIRRQRAGASNSQFIPSALHTPVKETKGRVAGDSEKPPVCLSVAGLAGRVIFPRPFQAGRPEGEKASQRSPLCIKYQLLSGKARTPAPSAAAKLAAGSRKSSPRAVGGKAKFTGSPFISRVNSEPRIGVGRPEASRIMLSSCTGSTKSPNP